MRHMSFLSNEYQAFGCLISVHSEATKIHTWRKNWSHLLLFGLTLSLWGWPLNSISRSNLVICQGKYRTLRHSHTLHVLFTFANGTKRLTANVANYTAFQWRLIEIDITKCCAMIHNTLSIHCLLSIPFEKSLDLHADLLTEGSFK